MSENGHNKETRPLPEKFVSAQFQPGVSGNPAGRPKSRLISQATRKGIEDLDPDTGRQRAEEVFLAMYKEAKRGNVQAALWLRETCEGKLTETFHGVINSAGDNGPGNVQDILMAKLFGRYEADEGTSVTVSHTQTLVTAHQVIPPGSIKNEEDSQNGT
jgi:hypothetical protein